jgi:hypothetical protein
MTAHASERRIERSVGIGEVLRIRIELWVAIVVMALAFGAGMAVRVAATNQPASSAAVTTIDPGTGIAAPPLTDEQIQEGLPAGHPDLSGGQTSAKDGSGPGKASSGDGPGRSGDTDTAGSP